MSLLYDRNGNRKYITRRERDALLLAVETTGSVQVATFVKMLVYTGARLSEVLALTPMRVDLAENVIIIETLKKRRRGIFRAVPMPASLLEELDRIHIIQRAQQTVSDHDLPLWPWGRTTAWKHVKRMMEQAGVKGPQATAKGMRHGFAILAIEAGVPLNIVQRWLGHAHLKTTAIYAEAVGEEERSLARKMWQTY